jgi:hypothetical protein
MTAPGTAPLALPAAALVVWESAPLRIAMAYSLRESRFLHAEPRTAYTVYPDPAEAVRLVAVDPLRAQLVIFTVADWHAYLDTRAARGRRAAGKTRKGSDD